MIAKVESPATLIRSSGSIWTATRGSWRARLAGLRAPLSSVPDVGHVPRQPARDDEDGVEADVVALPRVTVGERLGGGGDPPQPLLVEREAGLLAPSPAP